MEESWKKYLGAGLLLLSFAWRSVLADTPATRPADTFVLHLNGIGGERSIDRTLIQGMAQGGINAEYRIYDWTEDEAGMLALSDVKLHERQSIKVEQIIEDYRTSHPATRIIITCHSGGAGIAAWALARLPAGDFVDTWVMLAPALSPDFDLSKALSHVRGKAYAFTSMNDAIVLGTGTRLMGTVDRVQTDAAGKVGFRQPTSAIPSEYKKLVNVPYDTAWMRLGNFGDHIGPMMRPFARVIVAPLVLTGVLPKIPPLIPTTAPTISH